MILLQRLPGLGIDQADEGTRAFIDEDFADACRAGDVAEFIDHPYEVLPAFQPAECALMALGISVAAKISEKASQKQINAALELAIRAGAQHLTSDLCRIAMERALDIDVPVSVQGILIRELELLNTSGNAEKLSFLDCFFERILIDADVAPDRLPRFEGGYIGELDGRLSGDDLPVGVFEKCEIEGFTARGETTNEIMSLDLLLGVRVLLTVLKKLYQRRGTGRKESALHRGLDHRSRRLVENILRIVETQGLGVRYRKGDGTIWLPERGATKRVGRIIASPTLAKDPALQEAAALG